MADFQDRFMRQHAPAGARALEIDAGLRAYMLGVYNYMALGVALTGIVAYATASSPALLQAIFGTPLGFVVMLAPLGFVLALSFGINRMSVGTAQVLFWLFSGVMGLSLASIFIVYAGADIARVFFITTAMFGAMSLYGYTTRRNLASMGAFMFMGLIGIIIAMLVNFFLVSSALDFAISVIGVVVFVGLTAWDTQRIKEVYLSGYGEEVLAKSAIHGALSLYLDFINLFLMLLRLLGNSRN